MGGTGRTCSWERQLPSTPDCPVDNVARSVYWFSDKSGVRTRVLVEPAGTKRTRGRYGADARSALAKRALVRPLHLQGCACGHGGGAWVALPAPVHHSIVESSHCPARIGRKLLRRTIPTAGARKNGMIEGLTCSLVWRTIKHHGRSFARGASTHEDSAR